MAEIKKLLKNRNNRLMLVIFIIGIGIILFSSAFDGAERKTESGYGEEERLSGILSEIDGAGEVSVMISYEETENGIGKSFAADDVMQKPRGVVVVADGANSPTVRNKLKEAAIAVTGVGANRVCVYEREPRAK